MQITDLKNTSFSNPLVFENDENTLNVFNNERSKLQSWSGKFGLEFNCKLEFFKTFKGLKNRVTQLRTKYNLS